MLPDIESSQIELSLQQLDLSKSGLTALPFGVSQLLNLEYLELHDCCDLLSIAELPPNLKCINAHGCTSMERLPNLSNLKQLEELDLSYCSGLKEIQGLEEFTSIRKLILGGSNYSLPLTKRLYQIYFGFGHLIEIYAQEFPDWMADSNSRFINEGESVMSLKLSPNVSHNLLGMILCFQHPDPEYFNSGYSVENTTTHFSWDGYIHKDDYETLMVIVPRSIFPIEDGDEAIELKSDYAQIHGIHLLYKSEDERR